MRKKSLLFRLTFSFSILFILSISFVVFLIYQIKHVRGYNTSVNISGFWSRANHIAITKNIGIYYEEVCIAKKEGREYIERIEMHKKK
ncbi:MAG: hypothetical protein ACK40E_03720, partial [Caldimicrobium sp.]